MLTTSPSVCSSECPDLGGGGGQPQWGCGGREATIVVMGEEGQLQWGGGGQLQLVYGGLGAATVGGLVGGGGQLLWEWGGVNPSGDGGGGGEALVVVGGGSQGGGSCCRGEGPWRGCLCLYSEVFQLLKKFSPC